MKSDFERILDECLAQMRAGRALDECLSSHPAQAQRLRPLLEAAARVWEIPVPRARPAAVQAGLDRLLAGARLQNRPPSHVLSGWVARVTKRFLETIKTLLIGKEPTGWQLASRLSTTLVVVLLVAGTLTVNASASSLPGDPLYGVKRTWESIRLSLTPDKTAHQHLIDHFSELRRKEVKELIQRRRAETVEFEALLEAMTGDQWQVNGFQVQIVSNTEIKGQPEIGSSLYVRAQLEEDGTLTAIQVRAPEKEQPTPLPTPSPTQEITPTVTEDPTTEASETPETSQYRPGSVETTQTPTVQTEETPEETVQPSQEPEEEATRTQRPQPTRTPEPTDDDDDDDEHTPEATEFHESTHTPEPTDEPDETPESTEEPHETPEPTEEED